MRRVTWWALPIAMLMLSVAQPVQAGWPECRDVTVGLPSQYAEDRYVFLDGTFLEFWREWNGYTGLQRNKCITETGIVLGRDTLDSRSSLEDPNDVHPALPAAPPIPDPSNPTVPELPGFNPSFPRICGSEPDPLDYVAACWGAAPPPPTVGDAIPNCESRPLAPDETLAWASCAAGGNDEDPIIVSYINWLQYVVDSTNEPPS